MADIKLRIEVNPNGETSLGAGDGKETLGVITNIVDGVGSNANIANTSFKASINGVFENLPSKRVNGSNGLSMASDNNSYDYDFIFNDLDELDNIDGNGAIIEDEQNPSEFIWGIVPDNKQYSVKLTFTKATALKDIVIYGDTEVGQFPTKAIIDGTRTIYSDDAKWAINMQTESDTHTIEFLEWNRANYNACISNIKVTLKYLDLNKSWIDNVESLTQSTSDANSIQYGVLANSGSASLRDIDGELAEYVQDGIIDNSNVPVEIFVNGNKIQTHITKDSDYIKQDKSLSLQFSNTLDTLQNLTFSGRQLSDSTNAYLLLKEILSTLNYNIDTILDEKLKLHLQNIVIEYPYFNTSNYYDTINKICNIAQIRMIQDNDGNLLFINARPIANITEIDNIINIPKYMTMTPIQESIILKNKIKIISYTDKDYSYKYSVVHNANIGYYNNTSIGQLFTIGTTDNTQYLYSGLLKDYESIYNNYIGDKNPAIIGIYDAAFDSEMKYAINKVQFSNNAIAKFDDWAIIPNDTYNKIPLFTEGPSKSTTNFLENRSNEGTLNNNLDYKALFRPTLVDSEQQALNNLLDNQGKLKDIAYQIINGNETITIYFVSEIIYYYDNSIINYNGDLRRITLNSNFDIYLRNLITDNEQIINQGNSDYEIPTNELMSNNTTINNLSIIQYIKNNILNDYINGVSNATIDLFCSNLYYSDGSLAKNWDYGEILNIGDIVAFENDIKNAGEQRYWRVTGRKFKYSGSPTLSIELQEIAFIICSITANITNATLTLKRTYSPNKNATLGEISVNDSLYKGDKIQISAEADESYAISEFLVNGQTWNSGDTMIVDSDVNIVVNTVSTASWKTVYSNMGYNSFDIVNMEHTFYTLSFDPIIKAGRRTRYTGYIDFYVDGQLYDSRDFTEEYEPDLRVLSSGAIQAAMGIVEVISDGVIQFFSRIQHPEYFTTTSGMKFGIRIDKIEQYY